MKRFFCVETREASLISSYSMFTIERKKSCLFYVSNNIAPIETKEKE